MAELNWTSIIVALIVVVGLGGIAGFYFMSKSSDKTVSASGNAEMTVMPDKAIVYLLIQTRDASADVAKDDNAQISGKVLDSLQAMGIAKSDIETENYNMNPDYDWSNGTQKLIGYVVTNNIKVSSKDFTNVGKIVDSAVGAGALISYINFDLSNDKQNEYKAKVLTNASKDAKIKAEAIAAGLGKKLGSLVSVTASDYNYQPYPLYMASASGVSVKEAATNISPQQITVTGTATVVYELK